MPADDFTERVDVALAYLDTMTGKGAGRRFGFGPEAVNSWRRRRADGRPILRIYGANRAALERVLDRVALERDPPMTVGDALRRLRRSASA